MSEAHELFKNVVGSRYLEYSTTEYFFKRNCSTRYTVHTSFKINPLVNVIATYCRYDYYALVFYNSDMIDSIKSL